MAGIFEDFEAGLRVDRLQSRAFRFFRDTVLGALDDQDLALPIRQVVWPELAGGVEFDDPAITAFQIWPGKVADLIDDILCVNPGSPTFPHNLNTQLGTIGFLDLSGTKPSATIHQLTETGMQPFDWENSRRPWTV